jgi:hypothetical protein
MMKRERDSKGIVYILTNPCLDGWVKIGMSSRNDIEKRLSELNSPPNIPLSYRAFAVYEVDKPEEIEKDIHDLIDMIDGTLHAREVLKSGRERVREFFQISPEKAYGIFEKVAKFRGDKKNLQLIEASEEEQREEKAQRHIRSTFTFKMLKIPIGAELTFIRDDSIHCTVVDDKNTVSFEGENTTLSALAVKLLTEKYKWAKTSTAQGPKFFTYEGNTLYDIREKMENDGAEESL